MSGVPSGPCGHGNGGRFGATRERSNAAARPISAAISTTPGIAQEPAGLLGTAAQMGTGRCRQPRVELVEAAPGTHRGDGRGQLALRRRGVVHVVGGDAGQVVARRQLGQRIVARRVERVAVIPQLDHHTVAAEQLDQPLQLLRCCRGTVVDERRGHRTLAATGEHPTVAGHRVGDVERA